MGRDAALAPTQVTWFLDDVPGAFVSPWAWKQTRGWEPYVATIIQPDNRFEGLRNPVTLTIHTPGRTLLSVQEVRFERLYLVEQRRLSNGTFAYLLADARWQLQAGSLSWAYNIRSFGDRYRPETLDGGTEIGVVGGAPWKVADAIKHALIRLANDVSGTLDHQVLQGDKVEVWTEDPRLIAGDLPDNLGNSPGGGWIAAKLGEFAPAMLRDAGDIVVTRDGRLRIVDRHAGVVGQLEEYTLIEGGAGPKFIGWQKPSSLRVKCDQWFGGVFDLSQGDAASRAADTTTAPVQSADGPGSLLLENVYPKIVPGEITALATVHDADDAEDTRREDFVTLDQLNATAAIAPFAVTEQQILKRIMQPVLVPRDTLTAPQRAIADVYEQTIRKHHRRTWRVRNDEVRRRFVAVELGKIQKDGTVKVAAILADFVRHFRWQRDPDGPLSQNVEYAVSPFVARWLDPESLVFHLTPDELPRSVQTVYVGALEQDIRFASLRDIIEDDDRTTLFEEAAEFTSRLRMRVYWRGLYVGETQRAARAYQVDREMFADGQAGQVTIKAYNVSAIWSADAPEGPFTLLNGTDIEAEADRLAEQVRASYEQQRAGQMVFGGCEVLSVGGAEVYGELYEISVEIGTGSKPYETRTVLDFRPEVRPILPRQSAAGKSASPAAISAGTGLQGAV